MTDPATRLILASGSPRRRELLARLGVEFSVLPSDADEQLDDKREPEVVAVELARMKALSVANRFPDAVVVGSDTIVTVNGRQLGKPVDRTDARRMWRLVTAAPNKITTSVAVFCLSRHYEFTAFDNAFVMFKPYDEAAVEAYLATGDYTDKAGAWSIQQARHLMADLQGDEETIVGLPLRLLIQPLEANGFKVTSQRSD